MRPKQSLCRWVKDLWSSLSADLLLTDAVVGFSEKGVRQTLHTASFTNLKSSERWEYFKPRRTSQSVTVKLWQSPQPAVDEEPSVVDAEMRRTGHQGEDVSHTLCCCWSSDRVPSLRWTRSRVLLMLRWGEQAIREKMFHTHSAAAVEALTESPACGGLGAECCWCWDEENRSSGRRCFTHTLLLLKLWQSPQPAVDEEPSVVDAEMRRTGHQGEDVSHTLCCCCWSSDWVPSLRWTRSRVLLMLRWGEQVIREKMFHTLCCCWSSDRVPSLRWTRSRVLLMLRWGEQVIREKMFHTHSAAAEALTESPACGGRGAECCWCWDEENRPSGRRCFTHTLLLLKLWQSPQPAVDEEPSVVDAEMRRTGHQGEDVSHTLCCCWSSDRVPSLRWTRSRVLLMLRWGEQAIREKMFHTLCCCWSSDRVPSLRCTRSRVLLMLRWGEQVIREKMFHTHSAAAEALTESPACGGRGAECCWCWDEENRSSGRRCFTHTLLLLKLWQSPQPAVDEEPSVVDAEMRRTGHQGEDVSHTLCWSSDWVPSLRWTRSRVLLMLRWGEQAIREKMFHTHSAAAEALTESPACGGRGAECCWCWDEENRPSGRRCFTHTLLLLKLWQSPQPAVDEEPSVVDAEMRRTGHQGEDVSHTLCCCWSSDRVPSLRWTRSRVLLTLRWEEQVIREKMFHTHSAAAEALTESPACGGRGAECCWCWDEENRPSGRRCFTHTLLLLKLWLSPQLAVDEEPSVVDAEMRRTGHQGEDVSHTLCCCWSSERVPSLRWTRSRVLLMLRWGEQVIREKMFHTHSAAAEALTESPACGGRGAECCWCWDEENRSSGRRCFTHTLCCCWSSDRVPSLRWTRSRVLLMLRWGEQAIREKMFHTHSAAAEALTESPACGGRGAERCWCWDEENRSSERRCFTHTLLLLKLWQSPQPAVDEEPSVVDAEMRRTGHQGDDVSHTLCCCWSSDRVPSLRWTRSRVLLMLRWGEQVIREKMFHTHSAAAEALTESPACGGRGAECCWCWDEENRSSGRWCFTHTLLLLKLWQSPQPAVD